MFQGNRKVVKFMNSKKIYIVASTENLRDVHIEEVYDGKVFTVDTIVDGYKKKLKGLNYQIAILGDNENAVTALFKILAGEASADKGTIKWGISVIPSYLPKDKSAYFNTDLSIVDWLAQYSKEKDGTYLRGFLGRMLFSGDDANKQVKVLSGGEKVRCMLSRMMVQNANVIMLDQPTNHLDLESITAVNNGLIDFKGVVLFSSHDHALLQSVANRIFYIKDGKLIDRLSTYDEFLEKQQNS